MLRVFGSRQIRNRATMGGNIVTASPIGDSAPVLLALDAKVVLASTQRRTHVAHQRFFHLLSQDRAAARRNSQNHHHPARRIRKPDSRANANGSKFPSAARWTSAPSRAVSRSIWMRKTSSATRASPTAASPRCPRAPKKPKPPCSEKFGARKPFAKCTADFTDRVHAHFRRARLRRIPQRTDRESAGEIFHDPCITPSFSSA